MRHTKHLKREDGSKVMIEITFHDFQHSRMPEYKASVLVCEPKKRTFQRIDITDDYKYRQMPFNSPEREEYELNSLLKYVTLEEIHKAKLELWNQMKP